MRTGVEWMIGCPASGKTTLARAHAIEAHRSTGWPVLVVDTEGAAQLRGFHRSRSLAEAIRVVWRERASTSFAPNDADEVLALMRAARRPGRVVVLVDEAHVWFDASAGGEVRKAILRLMRSHRHAGVRLILTTQHLTGDIPQAALACSPVLHVFRCTSPATLERLRAQYGLAPQRVRALRQYAYLRIFEGFEKSA